MSVTMREWLELPAPARAVALDAVLERLPPELVPARGGVGHEASAVPRFVHQPTGLMFHLVFGDTVTLGMSRSRFQRVSAVWRAVVGDSQAGDNLPSPVPSWDDVVQLTPVRDVHVGDALVGEPLSAYQLHRLGVSEALLASWGVRPAGVGAVLKGLARAGWRLPSEAEWEYAVRAAVDSLDDAAPPVTCQGRFLVSLGERPELCRDSWHETWKGAPLEPASWGVGHEVVRGGGGSGFTSWDDPPAWAEAVWPRRRRLDQLMESVAIRPWLSL